MLLFKYSKSCILHSYLNYDMISTVHIRDANNVTHSIHNLRISASDMSTQLPPTGVVKKQLNDAVASAHIQSQEPGAGNMTSIGDYDLQLARKYFFFLSGSNLLKISKY